jgi:hypothetical protein
MNEHYFILFLNGSVRIDAAAKLNASGGVLDCSFGR